MVFSHPSFSVVLLTSYADMIMTKSNAAYLASLGSTQQSTVRDILQQTKDSNTNCCFSVSFLTKAAEKGLRTKKTYQELLTRVLRATKN